MEPTTLTAYGAEFTCAERAAAVLRARASTAGLPVRPARVEDLRAAVVGAHAWALALRVSSLRHVPTGPAAQALAAVLARAAGHAEPVPARLAAVTEELAARVAHHATVALPQEVLAGVENASRWLARTGGGPGELVAAVADLEPGLAHPGLAAVSDTLLTLAQTPPTY